MSSIQAWQSFIEGRIAIENGDYRKGLDQIDEAVRLSPEDEVFRRSRDIARELAKKSRGGDTVDAVRREYTRLAQKHVGSGDTPGAWTADLRGLLEKLERAEVDAGDVAPVVVAW